MRARWHQRPAVVAALLVAAVGVVYGRVSTFHFLDWDDPQYVSENPTVRAGLTWSGVGWAFTGPHADNWHPLTWLSHMLDQTLFGDWAGGHHLTNLALHAANTLLVFFLFRRMTGATGRSAVVAGLFGLHPLHVESVAWIAERKDVLSTCAALVSLHAYVSWVTTRRTVFYGAALAAFLTACLAKPMVVTLPGVMLLIDLWPLRRIPPLTRGVLFEKLPFVAVAAATSAMTLVAQQDAMASRVALPLWMRLANAMMSYVVYVRATLWPVDLAYFYPYRMDLQTWRPVAAGLLVLAVTVAAIRVVRTAPWVTVGWLWYLGTLVPVIGLLQAGEQARADRFTYVPLIGLFVVAAWGAVDVTGRWRLPAAVPRVIAAGALAACAWLTFRQVETWRNPRQLFEHAIAVDDENYVAHGMLGARFYEDGRWEEARDHLQRAVAIHPATFDAQFNLGLVLAGLGQPTDAIPRYRIALALEPDAAVAFHLAMALDETGASEDAIRQAEAARELARRKADDTIVGQITDWLAERGR